MDEAFTDLFHQSITESGYAWSSSPSVLSDVSINSTKKLAKDANCTDLAPASILHCLRQFSTSELQKIYNSHKPPIPFLWLRSSPWNVRVDDDLFESGELRELGTQKPAIIGVNSLEIPALGMIWIADSRYSKQAMLISEALLPVAGVIFNATLEQEFPGKEVKSKVLRQATRYVYVDGKGDRTNLSFLCEQVSQVLHTSCTRCLVLDLSRISAHQRCSFSRANRQGGFIQTDSGQSSLGLQI